MQSVPKNTTLNLIKPHYRIVIVGVCLILFGVQESASAQIDGFTTPFRQIELSSDETGAISELLVGEGQTIAEGSDVAHLDTRVQQLQVEIAQQMVNSRSELRAAKQLFEQRQAILNRVLQLQNSGHATNGELIRAKMEHSISESKLLAAREDHTIREIELRRAQAQLDRRTIVAPFSGVVAKIHRQDGEFLSPLHPEILTLVQVDRLFATFAIKSSLVKQFQIGKEFQVEMANGTTVVASVHTIGVQTDAKSGTVEIKLVIENPSLELRSGELCTLSI